MALVLLFFKSISYPRFGLTSFNGKSEISVQNESKQYKALIGFDDWSSIFEDENQFDEENEDEFDVGAHGIQIELDYKNK